MHIDIEQRLQKEIVGNKCEEDDKVIAPEERENNSYEKK